MPRPPSPQNGDLRITVEVPTARAKPADDTPCRILLLGDFGGRGNAAGAAAHFRPVPVDRDNFNDVLARLDVRLEFPLGPDGERRFVVHFRELADFHPDRLFERAEVFAPLRDLRRRLRDPATFAAAAAEVRAWLSPEAAPEPARPPAEPAAPAGEAPAENLLEQILTAMPGPGPEPSRGVEPAGWKGLLEQLVRPYAVPAPGPDEDRLRNAVDQAAGAVMRSLLHDPAFRALESAWRGLHFLTQRLETGNDLQLYLLDLPKAQLAADLTAGDDPRSSRLHRLLVEEAVETPGGVPWAVVAGLWTFGPSAEDAELLGRAARVARPAGAPLVAAADDRLLGCASLAATPDPAEWNLPADPAGAEAWEALRKLPEASYLGLALPRFLLRLPYGEHSDPAEQFPFEEMPGGAEHEAYLWGNPALFCACLLGQAFRRFGWSWRPGAVQEIDGLPLHVYAEDGESRLKPCAEVLLRQRAADAILNRGLMPLQWVQGSDRVYLARFQSLASPPQALSGRWQ